jgi:uncharacterized protein (TIGR00369 family)
MSDDPMWDRLLHELSRRFMEAVPHNQALRIRLDRLGPGEAVMTLPYNEQLAGHPETRVVHGGAITSLMDACSGAAVYMKLMEPARIATLDLRIDYLRPATPDLPVVAHAHCYKVTRNIAFVRCLAHHDDPEDAVASAASTFMILRGDNRTVSQGGAK